MLWVSCMCHCEFPSIEIEVTTMWNCSIAGYCVLRFKWEESNCNDQCVLGSIWTIFQHCCRSNNSIFQMVGATGRLRLDRRNRKWPRIWAQIYINTHAFINLTENSLVLLLVLWTLLLSKVALIKLLWHQAKTVGEGKETGLLIGQYIATLTPG